MTKREAQRLQRMIDRTVKAANCYHAEQAKLNDFCREQYGREPGDIDADDIIDGVFGGSGMCPGMSAADFDRTMSGDRP